MANKISELTAELEAKFNSAQAQVATRLERQSQQAQQAVERMKAQLENAKNRQRAAQDKVQELARKAKSTPTKALEGQLERARAAAEKAQQAVTDTRGKIDARRAELVDLKQARKQAQQFAKAVDKASRDMASKAKAKLTPKKKKKK